MVRWNKQLVLALSGAVVLTVVSTVRAEGWGTIKGQVVWGEDKIPAPIKLDVGGNDKAACLAKGPILKEENVINPKNKGVRWTVVYLMSAEGFKKAIPIHPALKQSKNKVIEVDQPCCKFEPHLLAMRDDQSLVVKNSAAIVHNVNVQGSTLGPNVNQIVPPGKKLTLKDIQARQLPISISCSIHGWMTGKVFVLNNPYFAVTDEDGKFEIKDAPAGTYRIVMWQEGMGWVVGDPKPDKKGKKITITADKTTDLGKIPVTPSKD